VISAAVCASLFFALVYGLLYNSPGWRFGRSYRQLQLGMTQSEVRTLFGRSPDFDCRFQSSEIWYYRSPGIFSSGWEGVELDRGGTAQTLDELPVVYDHVQLAFDAEGVLHAYTWIGETYTVESKKGPVSGSRFTVLSPNDF
jgi:outer membrane protein assembly factor BamE (lipoprotein component of BamABCDE complex)